MNKKTLVVYFSATGTTARAAREIAEAAGADLYALTPAEPYTRADLDWTDKKSRTTMESHDPACRPAMAGRLPDLSGYDTVVLGFPIWWYEEPRIVDTFLETCGLSGKTVIPFATSGGSGITRAEQSLRSHAPGASWQKGALLNSGAAAWAKRILKK